MDYSEQELTGLIKFDEARRALAEAVSIDEIKSIRDKAEAMRLYVKQAGESLIMQNQCAELKIRAERKGGQLLGEMGLNGGDRKSESHRARVKLDDVGVDKDKSARWQSIASIPEKIFEEHIAKTVGTEEELTSSSLLNIAHGLRIKQREEERKRKISESRTLSEEESGIYCSDCLQFMKNMDDESIDLVVTSPPYDNMRLSFNSNSWSFPDVAKQLYRIIKEGGLVCWVVSDETVDGSKTQTSFHQAIYFKELGFRHYDTLFYVKANPSYPASCGRYNSVVDFIFCFSKGKPVVFNGIMDVEVKWGDSWGTTTRRKKDGSLDSQKIGNGITRTHKLRTNVWSYHAGNGFGGDDYSKEHPATFPEKLVSDLIISFSNPGDIVFDCFSGAGTTCKMAKKLGRRYLGVDISQEYCDLARKRIAAMDGPK